ncbi:hypothetical protein KRX52_04245 [Pseudomonas sp. MAP12]|uniref:Uncharacterized protein n=1 Tax=Geopseudomonas aromaticivorans TaxID=2849492 RepID=A0ABS6MT73_9GAMM|nr:hypothetical protein [Pseudomonas aromaticivorans]MBV2132008.1 hypothetical protein [Pseudomonas aromaticivorans]
MTQPIPTPILERVARITTIAVEISTLGRYQVFANWSGYTQRISVHAYPCGNAATSSGSERLADLSTCVTHEHAVLQLDDMIITLECLR